ncbi:Lanthionine synthetase C-like protein, partial [Aphelenchoides avenae]
GPYTGVGGIAYALLRVARCFEASRVEYMNYATRLLDYQLARAQSVSKGRYSRYLSGSVGLITIHAICEHMAGASFESVAARFKKLVAVVTEPGYQQNGDDEILNGRAGFLMAVALLR